MDAPDVRSVKLCDLILDDGINIRAMLDQDLVEEYAEHFDDLPPVDAFDIKRVGLVLSDGFTRVEAAKLLGRDEILVEVRRGTREDAIEHAITANTRHGKKLSKDEQQAALTRLQALHPDWSLTELAKALATKKGTVKSWIDHAKIEAITSGQRISVGAAQAIVSAPEDLWSPLAATAIRRRWLPNEVRAAIRNLSDDVLPADFKAKLLAGQANPIVLRNGEPAVLAETIARSLADAEARDHKAALFDVFVRIGRVQQRWFARQLIEGLSIEDLEHVTRSVDDALAFFREIRQAAAAAKRPSLLPTGHPARDRDKGRRRDPAGNRRKDRPHHGKRSGRRRRKTSPSAGPASSTRRSTGSP